MKTVAAVSAVTLLLATAACAARDDGVPAALSYSAPASCPAGESAPVFTTLDFESARQQTLPDDPPPGWFIEYDPSLVHRDNHLPSARVVRAPEPVRAGAAAGRFELRKEDPVINHGTRAELATAMEPRNADRWYALSIYLPPTWARDKSPEILAQWHQEPGIEGNPPLAISTFRGQWEILGAWNDHGIEKLIGVYQTGRWTDWLVHVKWSAGADGLVQIWKDGKAVAGYANRRGPNTYLSAKGNYLKVGIYKWDWSQKKPTDTTRRVMYVDEVRIASTRAGVAIPKPVAEACYRPDAPIP